MFLIYGANGYTGELIAREAVRRGHKPILAGRNAEKIEPLANELGLRMRARFRSTNRSSTASTPSSTAPDRSSTPARRWCGACLAAGAHYLDITGEIPVFESIMARDDEATRAGVTLHPRRRIRRRPHRLPRRDARRAAARRDGAGARVLLAAAREISRGTLKTMIESIGDGGAIRDDGKIVRVPLAYDVREIPFSLGAAHGDDHPVGRRLHRVSHHRHPEHPRLHRRVAEIDQAHAPHPPVLPAARVRPIKRLLQTFANRRTGPDEARRASGRTYLWGRVSDGKREVTMTMTTPEGYAFTVISALAAVEQLLASPKRPGAFTPAKFFGPEFVTTLPGVELT